MKKIFWPLLLLVSLSFVAASGASAKPSTYTLEIREVQDPDRTTLYFRNRKSKRLIWSRTVNGDRSKVTWSKDRHAVAVEYAGGFLVWREGYRLRNFAVPARLYFDYSMGCVWSPDNRRLIVRLGASGASDFDAGRLFCLKLGRGNTYKYLHVAGGVRKMSWRDSRTVLYWPLNYETGRIPKKPRVWRAP